MGRRALLVRGVATLALLAGCSQDSENASRGDVAPDCLRKACLALPADAKDATEALVSILPAGRPETDHVNKDLVVAMDAVALEGNLVTVELDLADIPDDYIDAGGFVTFTVGYSDEAHQHSGTTFETKRGVVVDGQSAWLDPDVYLPALERQPGLLRPSVSPDELADVAELADQRETAKAPVMR